MKRVLMLATGDTPAYVRDPKRPRVVTGAELLATVPPECLLAQVTVEDVMAEPSWDTSATTMLALARRVRSALLEDGFDGVVTTHGPDTVEETAFLVDLMAGPAASRGGIVLTTAVRCLDEPSADGPRNLASSITAAADAALVGAGAVVCADDRLHAARWVTHTDATSAAGFSSAPYPQLGRVLRGGIEPLAPPPARPPGAVGEPESDVALIKTYPGIEPALLTAVVDAGARGIVLEGTGQGNIPVSLFAAISELTEWDIPVVIASRCRTGTAPLEDMPVGIGLATKVGAIGARGLAPAKARIALMVALGTRGGVRAARAWFAGL